MPPPGGAQRDSTSHWASAGLGGMLATWRTGSASSSLGESAPRGIKSPSEVLVADDGFAGAVEGVADDAVDEGGNAADALEQLVTQADGQTPGIEATEAVEEEWVELIAAQAFEGDANGDATLEVEQGGGVEQRLQLWRAGEDAAKNL